MRKPRWLLLVTALVLVHGCARATAVRPAPPSPSPSAALIPWRHDYEAALATAQAEHKPLMVDVSTTWCAACKRLDETVFSRPDVAQASQAFVPVRVDADKRPDLKQRFSVSGFPTIIFLSPEQKEITRVRGAVPYQAMLKAIADAANPKSAPPQPHP